MTIRIEADRDGTGQWETLTRLTLPAGGAISHAFDADTQAEWIRLIAENDAQMLTASLLYMASETRGTDPNAMFAGLSDGTGKNRLDGTMWSLGQDERKLGVAVPRSDATGHTLYLLDSDLRLMPT